MSAPMNWLSDALFWNGNLFGIEWNVWKIVGMSGNAVFFSRFFVQWYATERQRQVVVPVAFWWLSLVGSGLLLSYALCYRRDSVFTLAYAFTWVPYIRNLVIHRRSSEQSHTCPKCGEVCSHPSPRFCPACATPFTVPVD